MQNQAALRALRAEKHVSFSAISAYLRCPRSYEYRYLLQQSPSHRPGVLVFGGAIHESLATFYSTLRDGQEPPSVKLLKDVFAEAWREQFQQGTPVLLDDGQTSNSLLEVGQALLAVFHQAAPRPHSVVGIEEPFSVELYDPATGEVAEERLVGAFDAIVQESDGKYTILEHKTAKQRWSEDRLAQDLQVSAYSFAAPAMGLGNATIQLQVLLKQKEPKLEVHRLTRSEQDRRDFLRIAAGVLKAIDAGAFYPLRGWQCRSCPYAGPCLAG